MEGTQTQPITGADVLNGDIFALLGLTGMSDEDKADLLKTMLDTIETRVVARIDDTLTDEDAEEWKQIVDANDQAQNQAFLAKHDIDLPKLYATEALIYKAEMLDLTKEIKS